MCSPVSSWTHCDIESDWVLKSIYSVRRTTGFWYSSTLYQMNIQRNTEMFICIHYCGVLHFACFRWTPWLITFVLIVGYLYSLKHKNLHNQANMFDLLLGFISTVTPTASTSQASSITTVETLVEEYLGFFTSQCRGNNPLRVENLCSSKALIEFSWMGEHTTESKFQTTSF